MTAKQVRIRRDTSTNLNAATPADGELAYDTTNDELRIGDGSTAGGIHIPNSKILQNQSYLYASAGGTADALTLTLSPAPAAYVAGQRFSFKATATNATTTPTINVNSLGAKTIRKVTASGVVAVAAGDIQNGAVYGIVYDGTYMQLETIPAAAASQQYVLLDTKTASSSSSLDFTSVITSSYDSYDLVFKGLTSASNNVSILLRASENNGSSYITSSSSYQNALITANGSTSPVYSGASASGSLIISLAQPSTPNYMDGTVTIFNPLATSAPYNTVIGDVTSTTAFIFTKTHGTMGVSSGTGVNAVRIIASSGNLASGKVYLYGRKNT